MSISDEIIQAYYKNKEKEKTKEPNKNNRIIEGRIVHVVMSNGEHRPAIIVKVWNEQTGLCNLQVFIDGNNDRHCPELSQQSLFTGVDWMTSVHYSDKKEVRTWHWPVGE